MNTVALVEEIALALKNDNSDLVRKNIAKQIITEKINLKELNVLLFYEGKVAMRFSWLLGYLVEVEPKMIFPCIEYYFNNRDKIKILNFNRSLAKMFSIAGIPESIEGAAIDEMFYWLSDAKTDVSIKTYSLMALFKICDKHVDLKNELKLVIEEQLDLNRVSFKQLGRKLLLKL